MRLGVNIRLAQADRRLQGGEKQIFFGGEDSGDARVPDCRPHRPSRRPRPPEAEKRSTGRPGWCSNALSPEPRG